MSNLFISYGDAKFAKSLKRIGQEAKRLNRFDEVILYTPQDLPDSIKASPLFCFDKGGGYWLWKAYLICKTLSICQEGDIVYYVDAGCTLQGESLEWKRYDELLKEYNGIFFQYRDVRYEGWEQFCASAENNSSQVYHWMKPSVVEYFKKYTGGDEFMYFNKIWGGFLIIKKCSSVMIMDEWFKIMLFNPQLVIDPFGCDLISLPPSFNVHRHDQAILTPLVFYYQKKDGLYVMQETSESQKELAAIIATRKKDKRFSSIWESVKFYIKQTTIYKLYSK